MNIRKQAQILSEMIYRGIIDHGKFISWVDQFIERSDIAESWMIDLSLSKENESEKIIKTLERIFGYEFEGTFSEYLAIIGTFNELNQLTINECLAILSIAKDNETVSGDDQDCFKAKKKICEIEQKIEESKFAYEMMRNFEPELKDMLRASMDKHPEIAGFIRSFA